MAKKLILFKIIMIMAFCAGSAWAGPRMNPGKWEITTGVEMAGMPPSSETHIQCITNEDMVPVSSEGHQQCQISDITQNGNTVSWKISCGSEEQRMDGTGQVVYSGDTMEGVMNFTFNAYGTTMKNTISGRRIGNCDGQTPAVSSPPPHQTPQEPSVIEQTIKEDAKDVGKAAKDEAKQTTIDEVRKGVRGMFKGLFN